MSTVVEDQSKLSYIPSFFSVEVVMVAEVGGEYDIAEDSNDTYNESVRVRYGGGGNIGYLHIIMNQHAKPKRYKSCCARLDESSPVMHQTGTMYLPVIVHPSCAVEDTLHISALRNT